MVSSKTHPWTALPPNGPVSMPLSLSLRQPGVSNDVFFNRLGTHRVDVSPDCLMGSLYTEGQRCANPPILVITALLDDYFAWSLEVVIEGISSIVYLNSFLCGRSPARLAVSRAMAPLSSCKSATK